MSKKDLITVKGKVDEATGGINFKVTLDNTGQQIKATLSGKMRKNYIKVGPGDKVIVEMSPYDLTRGRISTRL